MVDKRKDVIITGQVIHQPEIRATAKGSFVATFTLNSTERCRKREGNYAMRHKRHIIIAYEDAALDIRNKVRKGTHLCIEGKLELKQWDAKGTGEKRYLSQIVVERFSLVEPEQPPLQLVA